MKTNTKPLILIVDDNPQNIQVLGNILYEKGYNISISNSGEHALQSTYIHPPDLILLDIQMPLMDGFEVCKTLKSNTKTNEIPVIFLTAASEMENVLKGFELGAVDYITKPFNASELTARVATHIELKFARQKLAEINTTKDKFFSIISHDLKSPAFASKYLLKQMLNNFSRFSSKEIMDNLNDLHAASENYYELLGNLLLWSKSQWGVLTFNPVGLNLKSIVEKKITHIISAAKNKNIKIETTINSNFYVFADEMMLNTVIINLLSNAIKFTNNNGLVEVNAKIKDNNIEVSVKDTGPGINESDLNKLFSIDFDFSYVGTNKEEGNGLGLILCKEFIVRNKGEIFVESTIDQGSTFIFSLPLFEFKGN